jgi:aminoglycoside 3-N-acetyltransferase
MVNPYYYLDMVRQMDIKPGSLVMVTADLTRMALLGRRKEVGFDINHFIDCLKQCLGKGGTLVIPSFNFNLKNNDHYHPGKTLPITGALAVAALKRPEFLRTKNPLHSFLVWGKHAEALVALNNQSSFAADSPFAFMKEHQAKMVLIDTSISAAFTFVHHVEEMENVNYRKYRSIGIYVDENSGKPARNEYLLYAKKPGWTMDLAGLEKLLTEQQLARKIIINQVPFTLVDLETAYPVIKNDIIQNNARNLARFSTGLYLREKAKSILAGMGVHTLADKISHDPGLL